MLGREHLVSCLAALRSSVEQAIGFYDELAIGVSGDVDYVIDAAVAGGAKVVVSGDRHLLSLGSLQGIGIVNAAEAVNGLPAIDASVARSRDFRLLGVDSYDAGGRRSLQPGAMQHSQRHAERLSTISN